MEAMTRSELLFMAKELLNSLEWQKAVNESYRLQQIAIADFGEEVLRVEKARADGLRSVPKTAI